ncbi:hypothetical protein EYR41_000612 [Orbilia oligospora]|uniref:Uncharacterized protein n=1 Tax=Orbilia oligospora TaxID=2813651 RepID=A0A8H2ECW9_ORBOL|nr:hypothetical protein EYR41_000612 [Orbilia oligospora]
MLPSYSPSIGQRPNLAPIYKVLASDAKETDYRYSFFHAPAPAAVLDLSKGEGAAWDRVYAVWVLKVCPKINGR